MIEQYTTGMYVVAYASSKKDGNRLLHIIVPEGSCICKDVYDSVKDCYNVYGVSYCEIGGIPVNYSITIPGCDWSADIPLPISIMRRYMSAEQKRCFDLWKSNYPEDEYFIYFIQTLSVY